MFDEVLSRKCGSVALANLLVAGSGERGLAATGSRYAAVMLSTKWEAASVRPEKYLSRSFCVQCAFLKEEGVSFSALFLLLASLRLVSQLVWCYSSELFFCSRGGPASVKTPQLGGGPSVGPARWSTS